MGTLVHWCFLHEFLMKRVFVGLVSEIAVAMHVDTIVQSGKVLWLWLQDMLHLLFVTN